MNYVTHYNALAISCLTAAAKNAFANNKGSARAFKRLMQHLSFPSNMIWLTVFPNTATQSVFKVNVVYKLFDNCDSDDTYVEKYLMAWCDLVMTRMKENHPEFHKRVLLNFTAAPLNEYSIASPVFMVDLSNFENVDKQKFVIALDEMIFFFRNPLTAYEKSIRKNWDDEKLEKRIKETKNQVSYS